MNYILPLTIISCFAFEIMAFIGMYRYTPCHAILHNMQLHKHGFIFMLLEQSAKSITLYHGLCVNGQNVKVCYSCGSDYVVDYHNWMDHDSIQFCIDHYKKKMITVIE